MPPEKAADAESASEAAPLSDRLRGAALALDSSHTDFAIVAGIAAVVVVLAAAPFDWGEQRDWVTFFAVGTVFPLLIVALNFFKKTPGTPATLTAIAAVELVALSLVFHSGVFPLVATAVFVLLATRVANARALPMKGAGLILIGGAWYAAATLIWWPVEQPEAIAAATIAATVTCIFLFGTAATSRAATIAARATAVAAPTVFYLASTRSDRLSGFGAHHHWSFVIGPAALLLHGGRLLWDVPAQYGFLSMLTLAAVPAPNRWQALYSINVVLLTACATLTWYVLQRLRPDFIGRLIALFTTATAVFLIDGSSTGFTGPGEFPSAGPFRFVWIYALLALLLWNYAAGGRRAGVTQAFGAIVWTVACLWSFESAAYAASMWIPASVVLALSVYVTGNRSRKSEVLAAVSVAAGPACLALAFGAIDVFYRLRLGHPPDFGSFTEFSKIYSSSFGVLPAANVAPWIALTLVLVIGATIAAPLIRARDFTALSLIAASWGAVWSSASYYVGRSHPNNATNLTPIALTALACMVLVARDRLADASVLPQCAAAAFIGVIIMIPLLEPLRATAAVRTWGHGYLTDAARVFPPPEPQLGALMREAQVQPDDPIVFLGAVAAPMSIHHIKGRTTFTTRPTLIPAIPSIVLDAMPEARRREYLERFMNSHHSPAGWLLRARGAADARIGMYGIGPRLIQQQDALVIREIARYYVPVAGYHNDRWELVRLVRRH